VTSSTTTCRFTWYVPDGIQTVRPAAFAAAIAASNAAAESRLPVRSAPYSTTEIARRGRSRFATCSKSTTSTIVHAAFLRSGTANRTVSPASYVRSSSTRCSS
jgi:hypothetical protein